MILLTEFKSCVCAIFKTDKTLIMGRRPSLSIENRNVAIGMLRAGAYVDVIARHFNVCKRTIFRLQARHRQTGSVQDRPRSGRPKKTAAREDRYLVTSSRRHRFMSCPELASRIRAATRTSVSHDTVRNRLRAASLTARRPYVGIPLSQRHRDARVQWSRQHLQWTRRQWDSVIFTDESRFNVDGADGRR